MRPGLITLLSDFGLNDPYVGVMKGVILSINPEARLVDISHLIGHGSILQASEVLLESYPFFPEGTVNLVVVDPGVGGKRRPVAVRADNRLFVGPDNGLFSPIIDARPPAQVVHLVEGRYFRHPVSRTFHGRDIFAPVAAHLSMGRELLEMGPIIDDPVPLRSSPTRLNADRIVGEIVRVDHFGNLITNITEKEVRGFSDPEKVWVRVGGRAFGQIRGTYSDVSEGEAVALFGSGGRLEAGVNLGRASDLLGGHPDLLPGVKVEVIRKP